MQRDTAEILALRALGWLAGSEVLLPGFLAASGLGLAELSTRARDPDLLGAVLDFLLSQDVWLIDCAAALGERPEVLLAARRALPGGEVPHWT